MNSFRRLALIATIATYFLIFIGGLVRVSGAGLGCPDWPECFGRWIPPTDISQLPPEMDPAEFNFVLAWIEYFNRIIGMIVGLLIAAVGVSAIVKMRQHKHILISSILASLMVAYQGWQGSQVVASELEPLIVSIHMGLAFLIVSLLTYITYSAHKLIVPVNPETSYPPGIRLWSGILWITVVIQVIFGTQVRSAVESAAIKFPLYSPASLLDEAGAYGYVHSLLGIVVAIACWRIASNVLGKSKNIPALARNTAWAIMGLIFMQTIFGIALYTAGLPAVIDVLHLWLAALITGLTFLIFTIVKQNGGAK